MPSPIPRRRHWVRCPVCGDRGWSEGRLKYCSIKCRSKASRLRVNGHARAQRLAVFFTQGCPKGMSRRQWAMLRRDVKFVAEAVRVLASM